MPSDTDIILDGKYNYLKNTKYEKRTSVIVGADGKYTSVMAASIIAKVERDGIMRDYANKYPKYGFDTNVGYGTVKHILALQKYGATEIHRKSFKPVRDVLL